MRATGPAIVLAVCLALTAVALPASPEHADRPAGAAGAAEAPRLNPFEPVPASAPDEPERAASVEREVYVVAELKPGAEPPPAPELRVYTRQGARRLRGYVPLSAVRALSADPRVTAVRIRSDPRDAGGHTGEGPWAPGTERIGADALHDRGVTGQGVVVGVIGEGFRPSHPAIARAIGAYRSFGTGGWTHGTAVAAVVADVAPDAELHLAAIGPTTTPEEYAAAVEWLLASGADVVVDAGSYFGQPGDGTGRIARIAANASDRVVFVTSAGNYARRHWAGRHDGETGWVAFAPGVEGNALDGGEPFAGRVQVELRWDGRSATTDDYDLYLLRTAPGGDEIVASSTRRQAPADGPPYEHVDVRVPPGRYYVAVYAHDADGTARLELFASRPLRYRNASGSLAAPATAPGVLAVGAYNGSGAAAFSSRGPTADGRPGVDLVAPDSVRAVGAHPAGGTSFAAPYVAGTAALLLSEHPALSAATARTIVETTARDVGPPGDDSATGHGLVDARAAMERADRTALLERANETAG